MRCIEPPFAIVFCLGVSLSFVTSWRSVVVKRSTRSMKPRSQSQNQVVGNVGLFYVCYRLSRFGWNVMPTARNAKGIDILIYSQDATRTHTLQVKALSKRNPVPLGGKLEGHF